jgi:GAF domain-containing protein
MSVSGSKKIVPFSQLRARTAQVLQATSGGRDQKLAAVAQFLHDSVAIFDWVGFYLVDPNADRELILGPYTGAHTDHTRIKFGQGICGQAAERLETFVIQDVSKESNYLSCSSDVQSEIVLPVFKDGAFVAELDIDSHALAPFSDEHRIVLEGICADLEVVF